MAQYNQEFADSYLKRDGVADLLEISTAKDFFVSSSACKDDGGR